MPDFLSGLSQALTQARTGSLQGQISAEDTNYQRALQAQLLANQEEQKQWQRSHGDTGDLLKLLGIQGVLADKGIGGAPTNIGEVRSQLGGAPAAPVAPGGPTATPPAPKPDTTFMDIASGGAASPPTPAPAPPPTPAPQAPAAPPPAPKGLTVSPTAGNKSLDRQNKLAVAQRVQTVDVPMPDGKSSFKFTYDTHTGKGLVPKAMWGQPGPNGKPFAAGDSATVADFPAGVKPTAQSASGGVSQADKFVATQYQNAIKSELVLQGRYATLLAHYDGMLKNNPQALESGIIAYASIADNSTQMRQGLIKMVQDNLIPNWDGQMTAAIARRLAGVLPPEVIQGMKENADQVMQEHRANVERLYQNAIKQAPGAAQLIQAPDVIYGGSAAPKSAATPESKDARNKARAKIGLPPLP